MRVVNAQKRAFAGIGHTPFMNERMLAKDLIYINGIQFIGHNYYYYKLKNESLLHHFMNLTFAKETAVK